MNENVNNGVNSEGNKDNLVTNPAPDKETVSNAPVNPVPNRAPMGNAPVNPMPNRAPMGNAPVNPMPNRAPMGNAPVNSMPNRAPMGNAPVNPMPNRVPMGNAPVNSMPNRVPMGNAPVNPMPNRAPMGSAPVNPVVNRAPIGNAPVNPVPNPQPTVVSNTQPLYNAQAAQYSSYNNATVEPEKKEPAKDKKKGKIIAVVIMAIVFLFAVTVLVISLFSSSESEGPAVNGDDTEMNLVEVPDEEDGDIPTEGVLTPKQIYQKVHESSVGVLVYTRNQQEVYSEGTGVVMGLNNDKTVTYIITCAHVIDVRNPQIVVQTDDGTQYDAFVVGVDAKTDIGLLRVNATNLKAAEFAVSDDLTVGDSVYAIGNPGGTQFFGSFTEGMVSAIARPIDSPVGYEVACVQHTAAINPGNSGGALLNEYGQVIGINSSKIASTEYEGMGFAVPTHTVKEVVDELIKNGYVSNRPVLGLTFVPASQNQTYSIVVKANKLPAGSIVIEEIMAGSDLLNSDVKSGDMITAVNGKKLDTYDVLLEVIENGNVGDVLTLEICRVDSTTYDITTFEVKVKLVEDTSTSTVQNNSSGNDFVLPFDE